MAWEPPSAESLQSLLPGFEKVAFISRGGMGAVYRAFQPELERKVAVKVLPAALRRSDAGFAHRFMQEAQALASLSHPGIVSIFEAGELMDESLYFVMEFVQGRDLGKVLAAEGRLGADVVLRLAVEACDALHAAHERGIIHRDIKPANLMLADEGQVKLADFGLARTPQSGELELTRTNLVLGTPHFVAPELASGAAPSVQSDIYALGVTLYQLLTGQIPQGAFMPPSKLVSGLDKRWDSLVLQALSTDPEHRQKNALELKLRLQALQRPARSRGWLWALCTCLIAGGIGHGFMPKTRPTAIERGPGPSSGISSPKLIRAESVNASIEQPFTNSLGMKFVPLPGTKTLMCIHETRVRDYAAYAAAVPGVNNDWRLVTRIGVPVSHGDDYPVVNTTWNDANGFCQWLRQKEGQPYRLPTDREWSIAIGIAHLEHEGESPEKLGMHHQSLYPWGTQWPPPQGFGNFNDTAHHATFNEGTIPGYSDGFATTSPVMSFPPNDLGIYDLSGNVWEHCQDWFNDTQRERVLRGAHFGDIKLKYYVASFRGTRMVHQRFLSDGFRCVLETSNEHPPVSRRLLALPSPTPAQPAKTTPPMSPGSIHLELATEHGGQQPISIFLRATGQNTPLGDFAPGTHSLNCSSWRDGIHYLLFRSAGCAFQMREITLNNGTPDPVEPVTLHRQRYVIVRAAFARSGGRDLTGPDVSEARLALGHYCGPTPLGHHEWEVRQQNKSGWTDGFVPEPWISFNAFRQYFGILTAAPGATYTSMTTAPSRGYVPKPRRLEKGQLFYFRTYGRNSTTDQGYGKLEVEDIVTTPPSNLPAPAPRLW